jgi:hypothetical protein
MSCFETAYLFKDKESSQLTDSMSTFVDTYIDFEKKILNTIKGINFKKAVLSDLYFSAMKNESNQIKIPCLSL